MADIYLAACHGPMGFNKLVVLKLLRLMQSDSDRMIMMFTDEARLAARLSHPNIVDTYEVGDNDGELYIAMEYLDGQPINRIQREARARQLITPAMWCRVISQALAGLHYAHELKDYDETPLNIVHRDISPHNIFVTYTGQVKVVDFGIAKAALNSQVTETGILKGKLSFAAPEQITGASDRRSDVYSMGVTLWELIAGQRLFGSAVPVNLLSRAIQESLPRLSDVLPDAPPELDALLSRALQRDPAARFQTADEMRQALEEYIASTGQTLRDSDLGEVLSQVFAEARANLRQQIESYMHNARSSKSALPSHPPTLSTQLALARPGDVSGVTLGQAGAPHPAASEAPPTTTKKHSKRVVLAGALLSVLVATGATVLTSERRHGAQPDPGNNATSAVANLAEVPSPAVEPQGPSLPPTTSEPVVPNREAAPEPPLAQPKETEAAPRRADAAPRIQPPVRAEAPKSSLHKASRGSAVAAPYAPPTSSAAEPPPPGPQRQPPPAPSVKILDDNDPRDRVRIVDN